ncbi:MAG: lmo0937 family membrane protein [Bacteroidota bacterium]
MGKNLYLIAFILLLLWAIGFFVYNIGSSIHILLIIASIVVLISVIKEK